VLAGLLIGLIIAFVWDKQDTRVRGTRNLGDARAPLLLSLSGKDLGAGPLAPPRSPAGLDFSELARSAARALDQDHHLLLVAGASPGQATSVVAVNLAVALARIHSSVILVCPSGQGTPRLLGVPESRTLDMRAAAELAAGQLSVEEIALQPAGFPGLRAVVLAEELYDLQQAQARVLAEQLRISAAYVVVEAPAGSAGPDTLALAEYCGGALLTVEISVTRRPDIEDGINRITRLGTPVLGLVALPRLSLPAPAQKGTVPSSGPARLRKTAGLLAAAPGRPRPKPAAQDRDEAAVSAVPADAAAPGRPRPKPAAQDRKDDAAVSAVQADAADRPSGN
jgi:Mrp family chromosome partitioning ATPase